MFRRTKFHLNLLIVCFAVTTLILFSILVHTENSINNKAAPPRYTTNSFNVHYGETLQLDETVGRSGNFIRLKDQRYAGWAAFCYIRCTPSCLPVDIDKKPQVNPLAVPGHTSIHALREASNVFDNAPFSRLAEVGMEAKETIKQILATEDYQILIRWMFNEETRTFPCYILIDPDSSKERYLHEVLLEKGLAYPINSNTPGPYGESAEEMWQRAQQAFAKAREQQVGGFQKRLNDPNFTPAIDVSQDPIRSNPNYAYIERDLDEDTPNSAFANSNNPQQQAIEQAAAALDEARKERALLTEQMALGQQVNQEELTELDNIISALQEELRRSLESSPNE